MHEYAYDYLVRSQRVDNFTALIDQKEPFTITKDGKPVAIVLSVEDYDDLMADAALMRAR